MKFILELTTGGKFEIDKNEARTIAAASNDQTITLTRLGIVVPKRMVIMYPETNQPIDRKEQKVGVLHDGTQVRRHFGEWVDHQSMPDDKGNYTPIRFDLSYYPEIAMDRVATPEEYQQIRLGNVDYYDFLKIGPNDKLRMKAGFVPMSRLFSGQKKES
jgi:hypothetical protein